MDILKDSPETIHICRHDDKQLRVWLPGWASDSFDIVDKATFIADIAATVANGGTVTLIGHID